jgi:hypothetical protein
MSRRFPSRVAQIEAVVTQLAKPVGEATQRTGIVPVLGLDQERRAAATKRLDGAGDDGRSCLQRLDRTVVWDSLRQLDQILEDTEGFCRFDALFDKFAIADIESVM